MTGTRWAICHPLRWRAWRARSRPRGAGDPSWVAPTRSAHDQEAPGRGRATVSAVEDIRCASTTRSVRSTHQASASASACGLSSQGCCLRAHGAGRMRSIRVDHGMQIEGGFMGLVCGRSGASGSLCLSRWLRVTARGTVAAASVRPDVCGCRGVSRCLRAGER